MITVEEKSPDIVEITITGVLCRGGIKKLAPKLKKAARGASVLQLMLVADDFNGWYGAGPWWSDLKLQEECGCDLEFQRIALLAEGGWKVWMDTFVSTFKTDKIRFFNQKDISQARAWLTGKDDAQEVSKNANE